jgi:G3E family GTPase
MTSEADTRIPVTVVTGALGAGKTTLLNHMLTQTHDRRLAVIVNEFGDAGIDGDLIDSGAEELIELSSGCICCVVRGDLIRTLRELARRDPAPDGVLIETTGLANPSPVIQTFSADQILAAHYRLDSVVTLVDALHIIGQLDDSEDAADQIALADLLVLNKTAQAPHLANIEATLRALNPFATILRTDRARVSAADLLDRYAFDASRVAEHLDEVELHDHDHAHDHIAARGITSVSVLLDTPLDSKRLEDWLTDLLSRQGPDMLRIKGIVDTGDSRRLVIQAVHMLLEGHYANAWPAGPRQSRMVFIGRNLDAAALRRGVEACTSQVVI